MTRRLPRKRALGGSLVLTAGLLVALTGYAAATEPAAAPPSQSAEGPSAAGIGAHKVIASGLKLPWGLAVLPDGSHLVSERDTFNIIRFTASGAKTTIGKVPGVSGTDGEGGLLSIALSPRFSSDHWLYIYHTSSRDNRVIRMKYENNKLGAREVLITGIPRSKYHNGGRIAFGPDGNLYSSTGDAQDKSLAQNLNSLGGKILRTTPEGRPAPGNPFPGKIIYSYGHRNVQGLAWDSRGRLWSAELGQSSKDELNLIQAKGNYGWPNCEGRCSDSRFINPVREWRVADASPSGIGIVNDTIFMACLRGQRLYEMKISGNGTSTPTAHLRGTYGRMRTVVPSKGDILVTTSNGSGDRVVQIDVN